LDNDLR
jgi:hypothetical protein